MRPNSHWLAACLAMLAACRSAPPALDHQGILARQSWWDNRDWDWYERNIPFFDSPDSAINATYYYRWELVTKHLTYGSPETGYTFTEFIDRPFWSGAYGAISCPLGHQMYETRWLRNRRYVEDFARYWFETPGAEPRSYSNWYGDAVWATYLVNGDTAFLRQMLPHMIEQYEGWMTEHWDSAHQMFRWDGMHDGMETNINSRQTADEFSGAEGYRPTLNSYMYADARAIASAARRLGGAAGWSERVASPEGASVSSSSNHDPTHLSELQRPAVMRPRATSSAPPSQGLAAMAAEYSERAERLKARVQEELWDSTRQFFFHQFAHDEKGGVKAGTLTYETGPYAGDPHGRELIGYVPWQFNLPDSGYDAAWRVLTDTAGFAAPFGPTTVEQHDPQFMVSDVCCVWSGNQWPYATSQTLTAMANLLNNYQQSVVNKADYFRLLERYTLDQRKDGRPYVAEASNPFTGSWKGHDTYYHSEHYFHSTYVDLVITGLVGLRPRDDDSLEVNPLIPDGWDWFGLDNVRYRGREVAIFWDRDGSHYRHGAGLSLYVDGRRVAHADSLGRLVAAMGPAPVLAPVDRPVNFAVNNGRGAFPSITASYSAPATPPHYLIDGNIWYHQSPPNRWTDAGSGHASDTVTIDFGVSRPVEQVRLYFLDDSIGVVPPATYELRWWHDSSWKTIPSQQRNPSEPAGRRANMVTFPRLSTARLQLIVTHRPGTYTGLSEIEAWAHAPAPSRRVAPSLRSGQATPPRNVAINPSGAGFPKLSASFTSPGSHVEAANDGLIAYTRYSDNRWSARGTPNRSDWLEVDFGSPRRVARAEIHFVGAGGGLAAPKRYLLQYWNGSRWQDVREERRLPTTPEASAVNTVWFAPVETARMRVVMQHAAPSASAITELRIWKDEP